MASSQDEGENLTAPVTDYHFVDDKDEPVSFAHLPMHWCEDGSPESIEQMVFLHGVANGGNICKQVTAWKFEVLDEQAEIYVLSKTNNWIKLHKPRKIYEGTVRSILITLDCLHFVQRNMEVTEESLWNHLQKNFSSYDTRPSEIDLLDQLPLISDAVEHNKKLSESKFLLTFLEFSKKAFDENIQAGSDDKVSKNLVDDDELDEEIWAANEGEGEDEDEETDLFYSVCTICDNGGELLCCEGRCMRSFHATVDLGNESDCTSLGLSKAQIEAMPNFFCLNCQHKQHQCFACGKLGSSDRSSCPEVFCCVSATCGYFYHPECIAKLLYSANNEAVEMQKRIAAGESFTCPAHICHGCKERENKEVDELQFAVCRRCPRAYHRKCLPREIVFEDTEEEGVIQRAWNGLLPNNRVLIYCLEHKMDSTLGTPIQNHLIFPHVEVMKKRRFSDLQSSKGKVVKNMTFLGVDDSPKERLVLKITKHFVQMSPDGYDICSSRKRERLFSGKDHEYVKGSNTEDACRTSLNDNVKPFSETVDAETKRRITTLMARTPSITLEEIRRNHKAPSTHAHSLKFTVDKTITKGKVEGFVEAVRNALRKLEEGGSLEDAKAICGPEVFLQILKWKSKLNVYLAPFLHGMRYTSFGRHFTKVDKLKEIVEKLHWYVKSGDM
ncbi:Enhanced downy mildew, partial [Thalictrum thalictroides]